MGVPAVPWLCCSPKENRMTSATPPVLSPWMVQEVVAPLERENWLIFIELQLSTACTIIIKEGKALGRRTCIWAAAFQVLLLL